MGQKRHQRGIFRQLSPFIAQNLVVVDVHVAALGMTLKFGWGEGVALSDGARGCGGAGGAFATAVCDCTDQSGNLILSGRPNTAGLYSLGM